MSKLSEIISQRRASGQSRTGSFFGSLKDRIKEKIDPRQILNQTGILTSLFPSLKAYKATTKTDRVSVSGAPSWLDVKTKNVEVERIEKNTEIFAKNSMYFSEIARDINVSRINVGKLIKLVSPSAAEKADMYYKKTSEMEKSYESKFKTESKKTTRVGDNKTKKSSFSWIKMIGFVGTIGVSYLLLDFIKNKETSIVKEIYDELDEKFDSFKTNFSEFTEYSFGDFDKHRKELMNKAGIDSDELIEEMSDIFSLKTIKDYIIDGTGPLKKFETAVSSAKGMLAEGLAAISPISSASASTMPSVTSKPDSYTGTSSLGRSTQTQNSPGRSGTTNTPTGYSELIGKYEGAGKYDTVFGKAGNAKINGKLVTENTIAEVIDWQNKNRHTNRHAIGKYGFIDVADVAKEAGINPNALFNAETQERMQQAFTQRSMKSLRNIGIEPTYENLSLAHSVGPGGAKTLLTAQRSGRGNSQAADVLNEVHRNMPRDKDGGNDTPSRRTNPHLLKSVDEVIAENRKRFTNTSMKHSDVPDKISFVPTTDTSTSTIISSLSKDVIAEDMLKNTQVLIVNRETVAMASPSNGDQLRMDDSKKLNDMMRSQYDMMRSQYG